MSCGTGGVIVFIQQLGIVGLIPFNNCKVDLTCVPVSGGDLIGWETSHHHHIGFAEVRSGRIAGAHMAAGEGYFRGPLHFQR